MVLLFWLRSSDERTPTETRNRVQPGKRSSIGVLEKLNRRTTPILVFVAGIRLIPRSFHL